MGVRVCYDGGPADGTIDELPPDVAEAPDVLGRGDGEVGAIYRLDRWDELRGCWVYVPHAG